MLVTFKTGESYDHERVAINPDHVVSVEPDGGDTVIHTCVGLGEGTLSYRVIGDFDTVVRHLNAYSRQPS